MAVSYEAIVLEADLVAVFSVPAFDMLRGGEQPFGGFGPPLGTTAELAETLLNQAEAVEKRMRASQIVRSDGLGGICTDLDNLVLGMWQDGWKPSKKQLNFWVADIGLFLTMALLNALGGELVFRSEMSLDHVSIWWPNFFIEVFPFHRALKCLSYKEGESFATFSLGVRDHLPNAVPLPE